ncbi:hypothetical protein KL930_002961 [Ogataea haglerorum]|uniref:BHLH domain-containing protein n=1 Tax=Ogataea haglerorum TaxID=1937702 RepID=A0AAN6D7G4_9ASCO|nr:uncharacterized protein KL911_002783 [Ogataea haglerorum]KAG7694075.1 hypothetical protein KL915_003746 [Ogataea haglerorum]KAG7694778.1 hypothetical protein KL951_003955 [Ogataea haglerorum]KAG7704662.1 hypothetical protein KL914_004053 [Ogataea haglerorum]KAG7704898.1 hypothetical protein KL950_004071 [Ogataea haglerorum]KAG7728026.1 hypothetical protein KL933_002152 [Ogataea haglerorum]
MDKNEIFLPPSNGDQNYQDTLEQLDQFVDSLNAQGLPNNQAQDHPSPFGFHEYKNGPALNVEASDFEPWDIGQSFSANDFTEAALSPQGLPPVERSVSIGGASGHNNSYQYSSPQVHPLLSTSMNRRSNSVSNQGRSYSSQFGTSLNNLISPASTYDGLLDSPYGSYQGGSFTDSYLKSPINSPSHKSIGSPASIGTHMNPKNALSKESKLSRRRELHNAVERRRRDLIKEKIKELGTLIPPSLLNNFTKSKNNPNKEIKANKSTILTKSIEYIGYLREISGNQDERLSLLRQRIDELSPGTTSEPQNYQPPAQPVPQIKRTQSPEYDESYSTPDVRSSEEPKPDFQDFKVEDPEAFFQELLKEPAGQTWMT